MCEEARDYVRRIDAAAPPLSDERRAQLAQLLRPAARATPQKEAA